MDNVTVSVSNFNRATPPADSSREAGFYNYHDYYTFDVYVSNGKTAYYDYSILPEVVTKDGSSVLSGYKANIAGNDYLLSHGLSPGQYSKFTEYCDMEKGKTPDKVKIVYAFKDPSYKTLTCLWQIADIGTSTYVAKASVKSTPTPVPTPTPTPQCTHVDIIIYHNMSTPCNTCSMTHGMLDNYYGENNPCVSVVLQHAPGVNGSSNLVVGAVRETGQTTTFTWGDVRGIEAWTDSMLTCK